MTVARVDVAIPVRDEPLISETIQSIAEQELDDRYEFNIVVVANACSDDTAARAEQAIDKLVPRSGLTFGVVERDQPGKHAALNYSLSKSTTDRFMYLDGDVVISRNCLTSVADKLTIPDVFVSGAVPHQVITGKLAGTVLGKMHRIREVFDEVSGKVPIPVGRMLGFKRELLDELPLEVLAEDRYLTASAVHRFGTSAVSAALDASVYAYAPRTWSDYFMQESRTHILREALFASFPEFRKVYAETIRVHQKGVLSLEEAEPAIATRLIEEDIEPSLVGTWREMQQLIEENARLVGCDIFRPDGTWIPAQSTKLA